jgi:hypothetical protein
MLGGGGDALRLLGADEGRAELRDGARNGAVRTPVTGDEAVARARDVEHRRQVDVHADAAQVAPGAAAGLLRAGSGMSTIADLLLGARRRAGQAADLAPLLIGHQQQRLLHRALGGRALQRHDHLPELRFTRDVVGEEDHAGRVAGPDRGQQARRRHEAAVAVDHTLARELRRREARHHGRRRRRIVAARRSVARAAAADQRGGEQEPRSRRVAPRRPSSYEPVVHHF